MHLFFRRIAVVFLGIYSLATASWAANYQNFKVAVYIPVAQVNRFADPKVLETEWTALSRQLKIDKVYIESTRSRVNADDELLEKVKAFFLQQGVAVAGGMTFEAGGGGQFESYCYTDPKDRDFVRAITEKTARHFDEIILDDFFFVTTKYPSDVAAKGKRSWTEFRLELMDEVATNLLVKPAKAVNPKIKFVIKFPNWYEHFHALGFDLAKEPQIFDGIYTGTETRDAAITDQHLQPYESYEVLRYFENIKPDGNGGGWIDTFSIRYIDRYTEQLRDTLLAKAREITLFNWGLLLDSVRPGERPWENQPTSLDYKTLVKTYSASPAGQNQPMTMATVAGQALLQADAFLGKLGKPVGLASYRPHHASGEDFLHNFLGTAGIPIELYPDFPTAAHTVLLTEAAKADREIITKIKGQLDAGKNVVITSGLLHALQGKGIEDIIEAEYTDHKANVTSYSFAYGSGTGRDLGSAGGPVLFPEIRFMTNDAWPLIRGETGGNGFPILLMDRYTKGTLYILTIPEDFKDLYRLPQPVLTALKNIFTRDQFAQLDAPAQVALFVYDNQSLVVESYLPEPTDSVVYLPEGYTRLRDLQSDQTLSALPATPESESPRRRRPGPPDRRARFAVHLLPHSFAAFQAER